MSHSLSEEYSRILEESRQRGEMLAEQADKERRIHPRLKVQSADLWISSVPEFSMIDMSASGLALMANYPLQPGEHITVSVGQALSIQAEVVRCQLVESATQYDHALFRIHCRFAEEASGMELLVEVKRREHDA